MSFKRNFWEIGADIFSSSVNHDLWCLQQDSVLRSELLSLRRRQKLSNYDWFLSIQSDSSFEFDGESLQVGCFEHD